MDSLTHVVLGGCLGQVVLGKKLGRKAIVWGAIADTIPDLDIFCNFFIHPVHGLLIHRGFTHSILFAFLGSFIFGKLLSIKYKQESATYKEWVLLMALGLFSHLFIDSLTNYGTGLLEPFCNHRFSYTTIFIADPSFTVPMLIAFVVLMFKNISHTLKQKFVVVALVFSAIYLVWTFKNRSHFESLFTSEFRRQNISISGQELTPSPLNNILWGTMAKTDSGYYSGFSSLFSRDQHVRFHYIPKNEKLAEAFEGQKEYEMLKRFAKGYSCISVLNDGIPYFHDLRFGTATGWSDTIGGFSFKYPLKLDSLDKNRLIEYSPWRAEWEGSRGLWDKIWGKGNSQ